MAARVSWKCPSLVRSGGSLHVWLAGASCLCNRHAAWQVPWLSTGQATLLGTESAQHYGNDQVNYAFNRGAGKQYGVHVAASVSVGTPVGPSSLSLLKRLLFTEIFYGSLAASLELGLLDKFNGFAPMPNGELQNATRRFFLALAREGPSPRKPLGGYVHLATTAIVHDAGSGWELPCMGPQRDPQYPSRPGFSIFVCKIGVGRSCFDPRKRTRASELVLCVVK